MTDSEIRYQPANRAIDNSAYVFSNLLSYKDRTFLIENGRVRHLEKGDLLCHQDKLEDVAYIILTGEMSVVEAIDDKEITIGRVISGDLVGEIGALFHLPRIASVVAKGPAAVLEIAPDDFWALLNRTPILHSAVYQQLYERSLQAALCSTPALKDKSEDKQPDLSRFLRCWHMSKPN